MANKEFNFIKKSIDALPIPKGQSERARYYDSVMRGLCIRITSNGKKSFYFYRKVQSRVVSQKLGDYPDMSIEQARGRAGELNGRIAGGEKPWELSAAARAEITLENLFAIYIDRHAKKTRKTWEVMQNDFDRYAKKIRKRKLSEISHDMANKLHGQLGLERGVYSANRFIQLMKATYNKGITWKLYDGNNPFIGISLFPEKPRQNFLTNQQAGKLLQVLYEPTIDKRKKDLHDFLKLSLFTGIRKSNLASLKWADISFANETLTIQDTKNGTAQVIALGANELEILKERRKGATSEYIFAGSGSRGHIIDIKKSWNTLRTSLGMPDCRIHDLRRSLGSALANSGINVALVKSILHHKDQKTTLSHYAFATKDAEKRAREAVQKIGLKLLSKRHLRWYR